MLLPTTAPDEGSIEECLDELNELLAKLDRYSPAVIATALRVHLEGLLRALLENGQCSPQEIQEFISALAQEVLQESRDS